MRKIMSALVLFLLLIYIGYQVTSNLTETIKTVDAVVVEVEDKITCRGLFVKSASTVTGADGRFVEYLAENGEKVAAGEQVAVCFSTAAAAESYREAVSLENEVKSAESAYRTITGDDGGLTLERAIFGNMAALAAQLDRGRVWEADALYASLTRDVVAREYPRDELDQLAEATEELRARLSEARAASASGVAFNSDESGYFLRAGEGMPSLCAPGDIESLTPDRLHELLAADEPLSDDDVVGYIVDSYDWYFVFETDAAEAAALEKRSSVQLYFPNMVCDRVSAKIYHIAYFDDTAVVALSCGYVNESFLSAVSDTADVIRRTYTGIRVPKEALRLSDGEWGVYCLNGAVVKFKPIEWVYQGDDYYIVEPAESSSKGLYLYDKIITRGKNLQQNMVVG